MSPALAGALALAMIAGAPWAREAAHHRHPELRPQTGEASFYGHQPGHAHTASGARFNPSALTAASRTLPLGARARVTNMSNGHSVEVTITDRGPFAHHRIMDVSVRAARRLGMVSSGVSTVHVTPIALPPTAASR